MADDEKKTSVLQGFRNLKEGEFVDPLILQGQHWISPLDEEIQEGRLTASQILSRFTRTTMPAWVANLSITGQVRVRSVLKKKGYDPAVRLDDYTLLARNSPGRTQLLKVLEISEPGFDSASLDLDQFENSVSEAPTHDPRPNAISMVRGSFPIREALVAVNDLPRWATSHSPGLFLLEGVRLIYTFDRFELGTPFSTVTIMPGESYTVRVTQKSKLVTKQTSKLTVSESYSRDVTEDFKKTFKGTWETKSSGSKSKEIKWTSSSKLNLDPFTSSSEYISTKKDAFSLGDLSSAVRETLDQTTSKWSTKEEIVQVKESYLEQSFEKDEEYKTELINPFQDKALTFVGHHILEVYVSHLDLESLELYYFQEDGSVPAQRIPLTGGLRERLGAFYQGNRLDEVHEELLDFLNDRYSELGIAAASDVDFVLLEPGPDHPTLDLNTRTRMLSLSDRKGQGPLPVCLLSKRVITRNGTGFVRTYADSLPAEQPSDDPSESEAAGEGNG